MNGDDRLNSRRARATNDRMAFSPNGERTDVSRGPKDSGRVRDDGLARSRKFTSTGASAFYAARGGYAHYVPAHFDADQADSSALSAPASALAPWLAPSLLGHTRCCDRRGHPDRPLHLLDEATPAGRRRPVQGSLHARTSAGACARPADRGRTGPSSRLQRTERPMAQSSGLRAFHCARGSDLFSCDGSRAKLLHD
jgi:hypothetical protein